MSPKYVSGSQKRKKREIEEEQRMSQSSNVQSSNVDEDNVINVDEDDVEANVNPNIDIFYHRTLSNKEICDREWLVYSKELDKLYCFCCKLFGQGRLKDGVDNDGFADRKCVTVGLKEHEVSSEHLKNMKKWFEMRQGLEGKETVDEVARRLKSERHYWKEVIFRIIALVKVFAKCDLAYDFFWGSIEMLEEFDPFMQQHVRRIMNDEGHVHYLGHDIQNELILLLSRQVKSEIIKKIKQAKYYSIVLDCTTSSSDQEQTSLIVRYVNVDSDAVTVEESFLGFLIVDDTTDKGLFDVTLEELKSLGLDISDMRGQCYVNGLNMKGKHQGVERKFLDIDPRAFYTPCGCHSLNLQLCDMANTCAISREFFGLIQRVYTIFTDSTDRWQILKDNVKGLTPKSLSTTRWESCVDSVKPLRSQPLDVREALLEVRDTENDLRIRSQAKSLAEYEVGDFEFLVFIVIWYEILTTVDAVSKKLQSKDMLLDVAIEEMNKLIIFFKSYREVGFSKAIDEAKKIAVEMGVDLVFPQRCSIWMKKQFDGISSEQEDLLSSEENFKVNYFLCIVDQAIAIFELRFEQYQLYEKLFGFLFPKKLKELDENDLKSCCYLLQDALKYGEQSDIDADELYMELKFFQTILPSETISPFDALNNLKQINFLPNAFIAYRVLLTIPITVASAGIDFSKLKLLNSYLKSSTSEERLNELAMLTVENDILESMDCTDLIESFASKNARRSSRFA